MKSYFRLNFILLLFFISGSIYSQILDSVQIGLPTSGGIKSFTLVQTRWANSPAVFESCILTAVPKSNLDGFRNRVLSNAFRDFSNGNKASFLILYTNADTNFASLSNLPVLGDSIRQSLSKLAVKSNRPELNNTPILATGFAVASRFALACGSAMPSRTAGMLSMRAYRLDGFSGASVATVPHLVLTGEVSGPDVRDNAPVYFSSQLQAAVLSRRTAGELIHQAIEMNASQSTFSDKTASYVLSFIQTCIQKRIPANSNPVAGPVTLSTIAANSGWLGKSTVWNIFTPSNYQISAFTGGTLTPASSQWFFDQASAQAWKEFHQSIFDSVVVSPLPNPVGPYCSGLRPSALNAKIYVKQGVNLNPDNYYRLEVSDITGNFDHPVYKARWFGTTLTSATLDSIVDGTIPDNFSYMTSTGNPNTRRYRIRLVSTSPYAESPNFGETDIPFCGAGGLTKPRVYLSTLMPYKKFYNQGDSIAVMAYKNPESPYTPGNNLRIELSNSAGLFVAGSTTNLFSGVPPFTAAATTDSFLIKMKIPDTLSYGPRYRIKAYIDGVPNTQSRQTSNNGHDITIVPDQSGTDIQLNTQAVSNIQQTTAVSGGVVLFDGGSAILERGVCWSTSPQPTTASSKTSDGAGSGSFISNISGLQAGTLYHVRAYARNANGTRYGEELTFTTLLADQVPVLSTDSVTNISQTQATSGGNITFDGNSAVTTRGICWNTGGSPDTSSFKTEDGTGAGTYISSLTGLSPGTQYCVRAYAINATGVGYGNEVCFTTESAAVQIPVVNTINASALSTCDSSRCGGVVSSDGGAAVQARGVVWSTSNQPTVDLPTKTVNGSGTGSFTSYLSNLSSNTSYYIRAYASNSAGTGYGDEVVFTTCVSNLKLLGSKPVFVRPNPAGQFAWLVSEEALSGEIRLFNLQGMEYSVPLQFLSDGIQLNLRQIPSGSYLIRVSTGKGPINIPLIKF